MRFSRERFFAKFGVFIIVWSAFFGSSAANAAEITYIRDTLSSMKTSTNAGHTITFYVPTAFGNGDDINLSFATSTNGQTNFTFVSGTTMTGTIAISTSTLGSGAGACADATYAAASWTSTGQNAGNLAGRWYAATSTNGSGRPTLTLYSPSAYQAQYPAGCFKLEVGTTTNVFTNPDSSSATSTQFLLNVTAGSDSAQGSVAIVSNDAFSSTATNTPSMTFEVGTMATATTCDDTTATASFATTGLSFYDLRADFVEPTSNKVCTRVSTNAANGAVVQVKSQFGRMTSTRNGVTFPASAQSAGSQTINITNSVGLNTSTEAYGICGVSGGAGVATPASAAPLPLTSVSTTCATTQDQALNGSQQFEKLATTFTTIWSTTQATNRAYMGLHLKAAVTVNTPVSNTYSDTLTFLSYATF